MATKEDKMKAEFKRQMEAMEAQAEVSAPAVQAEVPAEDTVSDIRAEIASMDIYAFMPQAAKKRVEEVGTFPAPPGRDFDNPDGSHAVVKIRKLTFDEITQINDRYRERDVLRNKRGRVEMTTTGNAAVVNDVDGAKMTDAMIAAALVFPNLEDQQLMRAYGVVGDPAGLVRKIFNTTAAYNYMARLVMDFSGLSRMQDEDEEESVETLMVERAKN